MQNHGLVTTSDDWRECNALHIEVNEIIRKHIGAAAPYPAPELQETEGGFFCGAPLLLEFFRNRGVEVFERFQLYPDQLVYLNGNCKEGKIEASGEGVLFKASRAEAFAMLETLMGYAFVITFAEKNGLALSTMGQAGVDFINNWESEKYRKSLIK
jgi:hypothetical protein